MNMDVRRHDRRYQKKIHPGNMVSKEAKASRKQIRKCKKRAIPGII